MLGSNYIKVNNVPIPNPTAVQVAFTNIETIKTSETGKDIGVVTRLEKKIYTLTMQTTSTWRDQMRTFCNLATCTFTFNGTAMTGRLRITGETLAPDSEFAARTNGLWTLTVTFTEV